MYRNNIVNIIYIYIIIVIIINLQQSSTTSTTFLYLPSNWSIFIHADDTHLLAISAKVEGLPQHDAILMLLVHKSQDPGQSVSFMLPGWQKNTLDWFEINRRFYQWIGLRENLNRKPWFLPSNWLGFPVNFPIIQFYDF